MQIINGYVEIESARDVQPFGEWVSFKDAVGQEIHITPEVVAQLVETAILVAQEMERENADAVPRAELLKQLMPGLKKLFQQEYENNGNLK